MFLRHVLIYLQWEPVQYFNNKIICDLVEGKPMGVIAIMVGAGFRSRGEMSAVFLVFIVYSALPFFPGLFTSVWSLHSAWSVLERNITSHCERQARSQRHTNPHIYTYTKARIDTYACTHTHTQALFHRRLEAYAPMPGKTMCPLKSDQIINVQQ